MHERSPHGSLCLVEDDESLGRKCAISESESKNAGQMDLEKTVQRGCMRRIRC